GRPGRVVCPGILTRWTESGGWLATGADFPLVGCQSRIPAIRVAASRPARDGQKRRFRPPWPAPGQQQRRKRTDDRDLEPRADRTRTDSSWILQVTDPRVPASSSGINRTYGICKHKSFHSGMRSDSVILKV